MGSVAEATKGYPVIPTLLVSTIVFTVMAAFSEELYDASYRMATRLLVTRMLKATSAPFPSGWPYPGTSTAEVAKLFVETTKKARPEIFEAPAFEKPCHVVFAAAALTTGLVMTSAEPSYDDLRRATAMAVLRLDERINRLRRRGRLNRLDEYLSQYIKAVLAGGLIELSTHDSSASENPIF